VAENWFWVTLAAIVVGVGVWYLAQARTEDGMPEAVSPAAEEKAPPVETRHPKGAAPGQVEANAVPQSQATPEASPMEGERPPAGQTASADRSPDPPAVTAPRETPSPETSRTPPAAPAMTPPAAAKAEPEGTLPAAGAIKPRSSPFSGNWLYVPDPSEKNAPGAYPATYVELLMAEEHGRLRGAYRAEYRVTDRAVSPEVAFQVEGDAPAETTAHLQWTAADGAKGDVDLALSGPNLLKITWWTTEFGRHSKLASGTSKLIRQLSR
jgi:hypothetical protein